MANYVIHKLERLEEKIAVLDDLYTYMRKQDRREVEACCTGSVLEELEIDIFKSNECWAAFTKKDCQLIACWGICKIRGQEGRLIWCLGTYRIEKYWLSFASESKRIIYKWANRYKRLFNAVGAFNTASIRWLEWVGAEFGTHAYINNEEFIPFVITNKGMGCTDEK